jgi:membrane protein implicated in regulation of membrane protease activity
MEARGAGSGPGLVDRQEDGGMGRSLFIFAIGTVCVLVAVIAIVGHWAIAIVVFSVAAIVVLVWGFTFGTGRKSVTDVDPTDEDLERAKTAQFYVRDKSRPNGML